MSSLIVKLIKEIKELDIREDVLCSKCANRHDCRGVGGPLFTGINECEEFIKDKICHN